MYNPELYKTPYHTEDISKHSFLVTGGAGFIGSNIVEYLLKYKAGRVRVLDNLSNGYFDNIKDFTSLPNFEFILGDIRDLETCRKAVEGIDCISHQAALGSVPRSITDPITTNEVNIKGFLNMLAAAKDCAPNAKFVYAASSSTYGDSIELPKVEGREGKPLSPYAVTKAVNEMYAEVFSSIYGMHSTGLRYFNIFGPKQNPNNPYAAVIPIFCKAFIENTQPIVNGDGETSRDFTFVENAVQANIKALLHHGQNQHTIFNTACGDQVSLNSILEILRELSGKNIQAIYKNERPGDVKHSKASIEKIQKELGYLPGFNFSEGLKIVYNWYIKSNTLS
ncbi:SDR family oxidoreductase [Daejeonella lutea]|uniref:UDP-N-acetylglucosamine 4-epimerase n=1 Tax=Daejeonella lutea TaxID=572036 RepID=A0A1T5FCF8_9SPHI|nr:SDR family oxidoreductase [Daejeonella lutea]SKB93849.1 UDP-N-acetylglucosamine 4-epimerase [Daejeonella lutea]